MSLLFVASVIYFAGMGIHLTIFGAANAIGSLAIPSETTNAWGNMGTTATCTAQGFLIYVTFMTACWYYVSFSVYAYVGTLSNFQNIVSMEKYIHILVHVYPVISGIYLITPGIFNNSGFGYCFLEVDPIGCGDHINKNGDIVPCKRGPDSHIQVQLLELFWDIPLYIEMIIPAGIMIALYYKVKTNQSVVQIPANEVVKQAFLYLLALYAGIFPSAVVHTMEWGGSLSVAANKAVANLFADVMFMLFGLFTMLFYHYFTSGEWGESNEEDDESNHHDENLNPDLNNGAVEGQQDQAPAATTTAASRRTSKRRSIKSRYSFNIFDGTNSSGKFACFIFAGDSEDEREDNRETERWNEVQDHI
jgi:hypothetical protein